MNVTIVRLTVALALPLICVCIPSLSVAEGIKNPWHNKSDALDVNNNNHAALNDFQLILHTMEQGGFRTLGSTNESGLFIDIDNDHSFTARDINTWYETFTGIPPHRFNIRAATISFSTSLTNGEYVLNVFPYSDLESFEIDLSITNGNQFNTLPETPILRVGEAYVWSLSAREQSTLIEIDSGFFLHHGGHNCGTCDGIPATICGTDNDDVIYGTSTGAVIIGGGGADIIYGGSSADTICGGDGADTINGGNGDDTLHGGSGNDTINGSHGINEIHGGEGDDFISGGPHADLIYGNSGDDIINSWAGDDLVYGGDGNDSIDTGTDDDEAHGGNGDDYLNGSSGEDRLSGSMGNDELHGGFGDDILFGAEGNDVIYGENGEDEIYGQDGNDLLRGGRDNDLIMGNDGNDELHGDNNDDTLFGGNGNDYLYGHAGDDSLIGNDGNDLCHGWTHVNGDFGHPSCEQAYDTEF